jgi:hypothetical protein
MAARLPVINLGREAGVLPAAVVGPGVPAEDAAAVRGPAAVQPTAQELAAATLLQRALPEEVWQRVRKAPGFARLREDLGRRIARGHNVAALVQHLPTEHIVRAHDPAGYLRAVIQRAAGGVERTAWAELVLRGLGADLGGEVLACRAWPGLAARLAQWQTRGLPLAELIADLPAGRLAQARFPAAYARSVLAATIAAREEDPGSTERTGNGPTPQRRSSPPPGPRSASLRRDTNRGDGPADGVAKHPASTQDPTRLDPASAVDRVGIAARLGTGSVADDEAREALLDLAAAPGNGDAGQPAAAAASAEAGVYRVAAVPERNTAAPATGARNNPDGAATGRLDEHRSAADRATAAEAAHGVGSAAARAEVTLTPPSTPAPTPDPTPSPGHPQVTPPRPPGHRLTPTPRRRPS